MKLSITESRIKDQVVISKRFRPEKEGPFSAYPSSIEFPTQLIEFLSCR